MTVAVFGSINMDLVVRASHLPVPGQTIAGHDFYTASGGKGANQAVACARLGVPTQMIGCVGRDVFGETLRQALSGYGVDATQVWAVVGPSGVALITVDDQAENTIVIVAGANGELKADPRILDAVFTRSKILLLQMEVPLAETIGAATQAHARGLTVILDPAPAQPLPAELYPLVDVLTPNESEAEQLVGFPLRNKESIALAAQTLLDRGVPEVVIKLGANGVFWANRDSSQFIAAFQVKAVDTVAAGDAFNGGLAAGLAENLPLEMAIRLGMATAAISVTRPGAQPSMPDRTEVNGLLEN